MAILTVLEKLNIGAVSESLSANDIKKSGLNGGGVDLDLPRKIYCIRKSIQWLYDLDTADTSLFNTTNYLIALCAKYYLQANAIINPGGSISPVAPIVPVKSPIHITGADFATATDWNGTNSDGIAISSSYTLQVFWNGLNRMLVEGYEWSRTSLGISIINNGVTISGFDALTTNINDDFFVFISV